MRHLAVLLCLLAPAPAAGAAELMVVGRSDTLLAPRAAALKGARVKVDRKRCKVAGRTALAALARTSLAVSLEDFGACGSKPADAGGLYVTGIEGERESGADGWVYKLGNAAPSVGAGDPSGRFGESERVLWFWCEMGSGGCQRTLVVRATEAGAVVTAYDDQGDGVRVAGARVGSGSTSSMTNANGVAPIKGPGPLIATKPGLVRSFPVRVR